MTVLCDGGFLKRRSFRAEDKSTPRFRVPLAAVGSATSVTTLQPFKLTRYQIASSHSWKLIANFKDFLRRRRFETISRHQKALCNADVFSAADLWNCFGHLERGATSTMTDSPAVRIPLDPREQPILDSLLLIRDQLSLLKQDKSTYIKSKDVLDLYDQVVDQVHTLNVIREQHGTPSEQNRGWWWQVPKTVADSIVDNVLEDCFQLISLFFLTIGRTNEAPAM